MLQISNTVKLKRGRNDLLRESHETSPSFRQRDKMKKILSILAVLVMLSSQAFASEQQRKISSDGLTAGTGTVVKSTAGVLYDVEIMATGSNAWVAVYDYENKNSPQGGVKLVEVGEATSGNSKHINLGADGINARRGITVWTNNATAIVHYR